MVVSSVVQELLLRLTATGAPSSSTTVSPSQRPPSPAPSTLPPAARSRLRAHVRRLQCEASLHPVLDAQEIFADISSALECASGETVAQALLSLFPESQGGVLPLSSGLLHSNPSVRLHAVRILQSLERFESTRVVCDSMSLMLRSAYRRQQAKVADGSLLREAGAYDRRYQAGAESTQPSGSPSSHDGRAEGAEHRTFSFFTRGSSASTSHVKSSSHMTIGEPIELIH